jgi:hypothetical protein
MFESFSCLLNGVLRFFARGAPTKTLFFFLLHVIARRRQAAVAVFCIDHKSETIAIIACKEHCHSAPLAPLSITLTLDLQTAPWLWKLRSTTLLLEGSRWKGRRTWR